MTGYVAPNLQLPWSSLTDDDSRFTRIVSILVVLVVLLTLAVAVITVPEIPRAEKEKLPPQLAQLLLDKQEIPPPKVIEPEPQPEEQKPEAKPEEKKPEPQKPVPQTQEVKKITEPKPEPVKTLEQARDKAKASGLLQMQDELMAMRDMMDTSAVENNNLAQGNTAAAQADRSAVTSGVSGTSGGINPSEFSRDTGGQALAGRTSTQVQSELAEATRKAAEPSGGVGSKSRSEEEMSRVMDQHKGAIFQIYNRALRQNAALQGRVVVSIVIEPSGKVSAITLVTSELNDPELEAALIRRIQMITFPASNSVARTTLRQTFDFLPQ